MTQVAYLPQCCCEFPGCPMPGDRRQQLTAYNDEESNFATFCFVHQLEANAHWQERWDDYYRGLL